MNRNTKQKLEKQAENCPMELMPEKICYRTGRTCYIKLAENRMNCEDYRLYLLRTQNGNK